MFYTILSCFGYMSTLDKTTVILLDRDIPESWEFDWWMMVARIMMTLTLLLAIPIQIHPVRGNITQLYFRLRGGSMRFEYAIVYYTISFTFITFITLCAIFVPDILFIFNFLGGFCCAIVIILAPATIYLKIQENKCKRVFVFTAACIFTLAGFASVGFSIANKIN